MSVIFGLFYRDGKPVSDELQVMYESMKHFPHEKHAFAKQGNCGLGHMLTYNTPEAVNESMPKWIAGEQLLFVAEGRIDNREELFSQLGIHAGEQAFLPDGDLMLKAYRQWGEHCVDKLEGKWSLVAFDADKQSLFVARDKWDYTSIEYYLDDKVFAFAASGLGVLSLPFIKKEIEEVKIARLLVVMPDVLEKTYYKDILKLLPSHSLQITRKKATLHRYWNYRDIKVRKGLKLEDYVADLFENVNKAVKSRLRSYKPVAATLSGGLDSSTVSVLAAEQLAKQGKRLQTYSHIPQFLPSAVISKRRFGDEQPYIEAIVQANGNMTPVYLNSSGISPLSGIEEVIKMTGEPFQGAANAYWIVDIIKTIARENFGAVLKGEFGNATTSWKGVEDALPPYEILKRFGVKGLIKKKLLKPVLYGNSFAGNFYKRMAFGGEPWRDRSLSTVEFERSLDIKQRMRQSDFDPYFKRPFTNSKTMAFKILDVGVNRLSTGAKFGCANGIESRDPLADPRVIESALSIPNEMYLSEMDKWVLRTMMKGKLPDKVRLSPKRGMQSADITARLYKHREEMDQILEEMESSGFGNMVDIKRLRTEWQQLKADYDNYPKKNATAALRAVTAYMMYRINNEL